MDSVDGMDSDDYCPAYGNRAPATAFPWVDTPADPRGGGHNPAFSMVRAMDNGAVVHSDGTVDQAVLG